MKKITFLFFVLFAFSVNAQTETQKIQEYLNSNYSTLGITSQDINDWYVESEATSSSTGITNYYVKQRYQGIEIFHAQTNFSIKNGNVVYVANRFESNIAQRVNTTTPAYSILDALSLVYGSFNITPIESFQIQRTIRTNYYQINDAIGINEPVLAKLVYQLNEENKLRLAWDFTFYSPNHKNLWSV